VIRRFAESVPRPAGQAFESANACFRKLFFVVAAPLTAYPASELEAIVSDKLLWDASMTLSLGILLHARETLHPTRAGLIWRFAGRVPSPARQTFECGNACFRKFSFTVAGALTAYPVPELEAIVSDKRPQNASIPLSLNVLLQVSETSHPTRTGLIRGFAAKVPSPARQAFKRGNVCFRKLSFAEALTFRHHPQPKLEPLLVYVPSRNEGIAVLLKVTEEMIESGLPLLIRYSYSPRPRGNPLQSLCTFLG
jgi:hypothetical protein